MSARALLDDLTNRGVVLTADEANERLHVDAPRDALTDELRAALVEHKKALIKLLSWERRKLEAADRRGLVIRWAREPGYIALHDPLTGEWHEVRASECLPGVVEAAKASRDRGSARA